MPNIIVEWVVPQLLDKNRVAERISDIFNPYYSAVPFFIMVAIASTRTVSRAILYWLIMALFFSVLPIWDIRRRINSRSVSDAHIDRREDRIKPLLFALSSALGGLLAIYLVSAPALIRAVCWSVVITGIVITAITLRWKISLHTAGITSISLALVLIYGWQATPIFIFLPVVIWARLVLKRHTVAQVLAGMAVSVIVVLGFFSFYGLL